MYSARHRQEVFAGLDARNAKAAVSGAELDS